MQGTLIGSTIGRYRIDAQLGTGGMGVVYRAVDCVLGREVAIKILRADNNTEESVRDRFLQEAIAASSLNHPNILTIHDIGEQEGQHYIAMELVEGETVREKIGRGPLPLSEALAIAIQAAEGLAAAHTSGIVHRDIKPENLIVRPDGYVKILDFGLAKIMPGAYYLNEDQAGFIDRLGNREALLGTLNYMAPEQVRGEDADARSDLFSLGVVLYEMITGRHPFVSENINETLQAILRKNPESPSRARAELPRELDLLISKVLAKRREERHQNALELVRALRVVEQDKDSASASTMPLSQQSGLRARAIAEAIGSFEEEQSYFVGRAAELDGLLAILERTLRRQGQAVIVTGDAGQGKTALIGEFNRLVGRRASFISGRFHEEICEAPYVAFLSALGEGLSQAVTTNNLLGDLFGEGAAEIEDALKKNDTVRAARLLQLQGGVEQKVRCFEVIRRCLSALAESKPLVFFLDDLHWADATSLEAVAYLIKTLGTTPMMIVATARTEALTEGMPLRDWLQALRQRDSFNVIELSPFTQAETAAILMRLCPGITPDPELLSALYQRTAGNPYFAQEMIMMWLEDGTLGIINGQWRTAEVVSSTLPSSISDLIEIRLKRLDEPTREVLTLASVLGSEFTFEQLQAMTGAEEENLLDIIDRAVEQRLIKETGDKAEDRYIFHHILIQQVLYQKLNKRRQRHLHEQAAYALKNSCQGGIQKIVPQLAYHYRGAALPQLAFEYSVQAAEQARQAGAAVEQAKYLNWARQSLMEIDISEVEQDVEFSRLFGSFRVCVGHISALNGDLETARAEIAAAIKIAKNIGDELLRASALQAMGMVHLVASDFKAAQESYAASISLLEKLGNTELRLQALSGFTISKSFEVRELERASRWLLAVSGNSQLTKGYALGGLGLYYFQIGLLGQAANCYQKSIQHLDKAGDRTQQARSLAFLGTIYTRQRQFETATDYCLRGIEMAAHIDQLAELVARSALVNVYLNRGDIEAAETSARTVLQLSERTGNKLYLGMAYLELGCIDAHCQRYQAGIEHNRLALEFFSAIEYSWRQADVLAELASCYFKNGEPRAGVETAMRSLALARKDRFRLPLFRAAALMGLHAIERGELDAGRDYLKESKQAIDEMVADLAGEAAQSFLVDKQQILDLYANYSS